MLNTEQYRGPYFNPMEQMFKFVSMSRERINAFDFRKRNSAAPATPEFLAGLFLVGNKPILAVRAINEGDMPNFHYDEVLGLTVPKHIKSKGISQTERERGEIFSSQHDLPFMVLVMGREVVTGEEAAILYSIKGISPRMALKELQEVLRRDVQRAQRN